MDFLRKLFGGGDDSQSPQDGGIYLYVRSHSSGEVIRLRLEPRHELVPSDDGGYVTRKTIVGILNYKPIQAEFHFDRQQRLVRAKIDGGELASEADWDPNPGKPEAS